MVVHAVDFIFKRMGAHSTVPLLMFSCCGEEHLDATRYLGLVVERMVTEDKDVDEGINFSNCSWLLILHNTICELWPNGEDILIGR